MPPMSEYISSDALYNVPLDSLNDFASDRAYLEPRTLSAILGDQPLPPAQSSMSSQRHHYAAGFPPQHAYEAIWQPQHQTLWQDVIRTNSTFPPTYSGWGSVLNTYTYQPSQTLNPQSNNFSPPSIAPQGNMSHQRILDSGASVPFAPHQGLLSQALARPSRPASIRSSHEGQALQPGPSTPPLNPQRVNDVQVARSVDPATEVYQRVTRGYDYEAGWRFLATFLLERRLSPDDILRVDRAVEILRPAAMELLMPLSEEDKVFLEKAFQRTIIELEKLISLGGTPTVVWRRTGEICRVGVEFSLLTNWDMNELMNGRKFIYELFEIQSVVEYWERLAGLVSETSSQSVQTHCVLLKPDGSPIPCAFCLSIRRDMFGLPSMVIGQWLPQF